ncbi:hypothetical protein TRIP_D450049 [uncultured Paludibacter sp.]|uniref:Uncharacterized protein n=1 Tax=uncultured Paludibacter sp. TaxID=497635 RepID=A0A653AKI7_9BACT|nr:hypothetical protein TRIP_D450049 [uncultured Paludibacter sp.]
MLSYFFPTYFLEKILADELLAQAATRENLRESKGNKQTTDYKFAGTGETRSFFVKTLIIFALILTLLKIYIYEKTNFYYSINAFGNWNESANKRLNNCSITISILRNYRNIRFFDDKSQN